MSYQELCSAVTYEFDTQDRVRGTSYWEDDLVSIEFQRQHGISAVVHGTSVYQVQIQTLRLPEGLIIASCDCPRFADGFNCKHLYATIMEMDHLGIISFRFPKKVSIIDEAPGFVELGRELVPTADSRTQARNSVVRESHQPTRSNESQVHWRNRLAKALLVHRDVEEERLLGLSRLGLDSPSSLWFVIDLSHHVLDFRLAIRPFKESASPKRNKQKSEDVASESAIRLIPHVIQLPDLDEGYSVEEKQALKLLSFSLPRQQPWELQLLRFEREFYVEPQFVKETVEALAKTGRFVWTLGGVEDLESLRTLQFSDGDPWELSLYIEPALENESIDLNQAPIQVRPILERKGPSGDAETLSFDQVVAVCETGYLLHGDHVSILESDSARLVRRWQQMGNLTVPRDEFSQLLSTLTSTVEAPKLKVAPELKVGTSKLAPKPIAFIERPERGTKRLVAQMKFRYGSDELDLADRRQMLWDKENGALIERNISQERESIAKLENLGLEFEWSNEEPKWKFHSDQLDNLIQELLTSDWDVIAGAAKVRNASNFQIEVESGQDWFDLKGDVDFDGVQVGLSEILESLKQGRDYVKLDDGSEGLLPEKWLSQFEELMNLGEEEADGLRFHRGQALVLDSLLEGQEEVSVDRSYLRLVDKLKRFEGVKPVKAHRSFCGELRDYQNEALGWFKFLRDFRFGGCLADEMGLGKTIQILAMIQSRKSRRLRPEEERLPSLVVVPTSLIFNWIEEAKRFTPKIQVLNFTGRKRSELLPDLPQADLVLTTYGTLRRDVETLANQQFDYVIVDEAQAIKNPKSQAAKACRHLKAHHRIAMTGTPVENHLGDLGSLFDFINPGMFGKSFFSRRQNVQPETLESLNRGLKPFILRRTKDQVLSELPEKIEQVLFCEMGPKQTKAYREVREHYRSQLKKKVKSVGWKRAKIHVLEALLRLRQIACDPRLIKKDFKQPGCKIELLQKQLAELIESGHKALVFSQFTSLLSLVKEQLDSLNIRYEYLDGATRDRQTKVERFQKSGDASVFLISLKAGGSGLNLTSADYVYLLDPWWNPAVEAQAIDRAHRIGQQNTVMSYRLISKGTVEEKILDLQKSKRNLADAIMRSDGSPLQNLSFEDLTDLLS